MALFDFDQAAAATKLGNNPALHAKVTLALIKGLGGQTLYRELANEIKGFDQPRQTTAILFNTDLNSGLWLIDKPFEIWGELVVAKYNASMGATPSLDALRGVFPDIQAYFDDPNQGNGTYQTAGEWSLSRYADQYLSIDTTKYLIGFGNVTKAQWNELFLMEGAAFNLLTEEMYNAARIPGGDYVAV